MSAAAARCPRAYAVEAMRDGRLAGAELATFTRHLGLCPACAGEARALDHLAQAARGGAPGAAGEPTNELHVLRERVRLLAAFDRALVAPAGRIGDAGRRQRRPLAAAVVAVAASIVVVAGATGLWRLRPAAQTTAALLAVAEVRAGEAAVWSRRVRAGRSEIVLVRGALAIRVDHASGGGRLTVLLPDGELEDTGTTFTVSAAQGHTTRVSVQEGSVLLRIDGRPPIAVGAGETWTRDLPPAAPEASAVALRAPAPELAPAAPAAEPPVRAIPNRGVASPRPAARQPKRVAGAALALAPVAPPDPAADFRAAVGVLNAGASCEAAGAFASFLVQHPRDGRREDVAYLRVLSLQRCGARDDMRRAAREYLQTYPAGFRRAEVESLLR